LCLKLSEFSFRPLSSGWAVAPDEDLDWSNALALRARRVGQVRNFDPRGYFYAQCRVAVIFRQDLALISVKV